MTVQQVQTNRKFFLRVMNLYDLHGIGDLNEIQKFIYKIIEAKRI